MKNTLSQIKTIIKRKQYWRFILTFFYFFLPKNYYGDLIFSTFTFYIDNKRLPSRKDGTLNSFLFYYKTAKIQNSLKSVITCKIDCKLFLNNLGFKKYVVPTVKILNNIEEIKNYEINSNIICKPSHYGGGLKFFKNGNFNNPVKFNNREISEIQNWLRWDYYKISREKNYKNIKKRIIIEPILFDDKQITDFKVYTFKHKIKLIKVVFTDKFNKKQRCFYNEEWKKMPFAEYGKPYENEFKKPKLLKEMLQISKDISKHFEFLRVDLYTNDKEIYIGELTNHPGNHGNKFIDKDGNVVSFDKEKEYSKLFID